MSEHLRADIVMMIMNTAVSGRIEFFGVVHVPTRAIASVEIPGDGTSPSATAVAFSGGTLILAEPSEGNPEMSGYGITGVGIGEQPTLRLDEQLEFTDDNRDPEFGALVAHGRLRP